jgi:WD40 repeat protein
METLTTFQPPHMDTVTGLAISRGYLISGSKDKNLRLWSLDNSIYNLKSTFHAFNDYITTVESTPPSTQLTTTTRSSTHPIGLDRSRWARYSRRRSSS